MTNLVALPVLLPLLAGVVLLLLHGRIAAQRLVSLIAAGGSFGVALLLTFRVWTAGIQVVHVGGWAAPYGITLAVDLFSGMMTILAAISAVAVLIFAMREIDPARERAFFYPVVQFLLVGINLSFVTGDLFNLFVAFEVMLIASYFLLALGGTPGQLREGLKYLVINATASTLFLVAVALLYGVTRTLNMADLAQKVATVPGHPVITLIGITFLVVFGIKGALFPLYFWLPRSYYQVPTAIVPLFAGMLTKVGIYALVRVFTLIFIHDPGYTHTLLLLIAGLTMVFGVIGAISQLDFKAILSYHIISQIGYMVMGLGLFSELALAGTVFYMAHHIIVKSGLFFLAGVTKQVTGTTKLNRFSGLINTHPGLAALFFMTAISLAGIPPFSGFFAKFALLKAGVEQQAWAIVTTSLLVSLFTLFSMTKIFRLGFWGETKGERHELGRRTYGQLLFPAVLLLGLSVGLGFGARYMMDFSLAAAEQLLNPQLYIHAVLGR